MTAIDIDAIRQQVERYTGFAGSSQSFLAHTLARKVPALLAKVDELTAEREHMELNPTGTAEWLKRRVAELTAERGAFALASEQNASELAMVRTLGQQEVARLNRLVNEMTAEMAGLRQRRDEALAKGLVLAVGRAVNTLAPVRDYILNAHHLEPAEMGNLAGDLAAVLRDLGHPVADAEEICRACDKPGRHPETCPTVPAELPEATR